MHSSGQHSSSVVARELDVGVLPDVDKDRVTSGEISFVVLPVVGSNVDEEPVVCGFVVPSLLGVAVGVDIITFYVSEYVVIVLCAMNGG